MLDVLLKFVLLYNKLVMNLPAITWYLTEKRTSNPSIGCSHL